MILRRFPCPTRSYFFFQAEDGIRDFHVTGVQTCALPISRHSRFPQRAPTIMDGYPSAHGQPASRISGTRSEERRVGKECKCLRSPSKKKNNQSASNTDPTTATWTSSTSHAHPTSHATRHA